LEQPQPPLQGEQFGYALTPQLVTIEFSLWLMLSSCALVVAALMPMAFWVLRAAISAA